MCYLFFCVQFKKSGKEPKAGAELVFGNTTYKTKVRLMIKTLNKHTHFDYVSLDCS